jgi:hypothetical protein
MGVATCNVRLATIHCVVVYAYRNEIFKKSNLYPSYTQSDRDRLNNTQSDRDR